MSDSQRKKKEQKDGKMSADECIVCDDQFVDADEVLSPDGVSYHDTCLKCSQCDEKLSVLSPIFLLDLDHCSLYNLDSRFQVCNEIRS